MNIRKKLTVSSILMVLIPIALSALLCLLFVFLRKDSTLNRLQAMYEDDNGLLNVQTILYHYRDQILSYEPIDREDYLGSFRMDGEKDWVEDERDEWDEDEWDEDDGEEEQEERLEDYEEEVEKRKKKAFSGLIRELAALGYHYQIACGGQVVSSDLPEEAEEELKTLAGEEYGTVKNFAVTDQESSAVKRTYKDGEKEISVLAYCSCYVGSGTVNSQVLLEIISLAVVFSVIFFLAMVASIFLLTRWLSGGMKKSLGQLSEGVKQVQGGNYSYRIRSGRKDELGQACDEFDEMADYLERSVSERNCYEEARQQLLAGISHDLRTPLTSIKAYVEGLRDGIADTEEKKRRYYDALATRTGDLESLIDNLTLFSRFDRGVYHYDKVQIEFRQFLNDFFYENELELKRNHVTVEKIAWPGAPVFVEGDKSQIRRLLGNLIDNAIKYRKKEETKISIGLWRDRDKICLEFTDDGPGVPESERKKIFNAFYRGDQARQEPGKGSGLGLAIVREIMKGHGGSIQAAQGEDGHGLKLILIFNRKEWDTGERVERGKEKGKIP